MDTTDSSDHERIVLRSQTSKNTLKKKSSITKQKVNQSKEVYTGLNGKYWNVASSTRHVNKTTFDDDSISETESEISDIRTLYYPNKSFLTCRSPSNSFYLCQILENVYNNTKQIHIRWCSLINENDDDTKINENTRFKLDYKDILDPNTILIKIKNIIHHPDKTISLNKRDIIKTNRLLKKSTSPIHLTTDNNQKRTRINSSEAAPVRKRRRTKDINEEEKETTRKPGVISKARLFKVHSNRFLKENLTITEYQVDPFFEDNVPVPFISSEVQSKLSIRAVHLNDSTLLKSLIEDVDRVSSVHIRRDFTQSLSAIHYAIKNNNIDLLKILLEDLKKPKQDRCEFPCVTMEKQTTGNASIRTLGFKTAEIMASRGAREGNNALLKDTKKVINQSNSQEIFTYAILNNCSYEMYDFLRVNYNSPNICHDIIECIQAGHRKLAVNIIDKMNVIGRGGFTQLHRDVIAFDEEDLVVTSASDVLGKTQDGFQLTPIHFAAINPNSKYLKQLLTIVIDYNIKDKKERGPIHFAAACEGSEPLEYLLSRDVKLNDVDNEKSSPLHIAVKYGRLKNVEILLHRAKEKCESNDADEQLIYEKFGLASINQMNKSRYYPLHLAVLNNHLECVQILIEYGARIDGFTSISKEKLTSLMLACQEGYLPIVIYLIEHGAKVESRDRFKRTPLIHACMYGHSHIVSYLLRKGANANVFDSSSNTALHYSIAYGWYFCVKLLIEAGANINCVNCWQTTCLQTGFSKGHYGICDYLLTEHQADINFKSDDGITLVMITVNLDISTSSLQQFEYIVIKHKADCTSLDINGRNAFHYLALNQSVKTLNRLNEKEQKTFFRMAQILFDHHCNPLQMDNKAQTSLILALESNNFLLVDFLINQIKVDINADINHDGKTLLHYFAINSHDEQIFQTLINLPLTDQIIKMTQMIDNQGKTPFHYCVSTFDRFCQNSGGVTAKKRYESIVNMIRYYLETLQCDPEDDENTDTSIFYLLRTFSKSDETIEHPLKLFLRKTKNINILHHQTHRTPLLEAIYLREYKTIDILLNESLCDINLSTSIVENEREQSPLIVCCRLELFSLIRILLNNPKCDLLKRDYENNQAFHYYLSTSNRSDEYFELFYLFIEKLKLIDKDLLNNQGKSGYTPLHIAIYQNSGTVDWNNDIERTLINNNCNLFIKDDLGNVPLHLVFLENKRTNDPVQLCVLLIHSMNYQLLDTKNNQGYTPLHLAVIKDSTVCIMLLLKHHADLLSENNLTNSVIATSIGYRCLNLLITFLHQPVEINLSKLYIQSNSSDSDSDCSSTSSSEMEIETISTQEVWQWKFSNIPKITTVKYDSLLDLIIQHDWQGALSLIFDDLNRFHLTYIQVFETAILNNKLDLVLCLLKNIKDRTGLNETNSHGRNLFHIIANYQRYNSQFLDKFLTFLHDNHVNWNLPDKYGSYPLHYACVLQNISFIQFLQNKYSNQLDFNQTDAFGNTAYGLVFWSSPTQTSFNEQIIKSLITAGKSIDCLCNYDNDIAIDPLAFSRIDLSSNNIIPYPPKISNHIKTSPLINAIIHNHFQLAKFLLDLGADRNFTDEAKRTPLMHAVKQNNINMVKLLFNIKDTIPTQNTSSISQQPTQKRSKPKGFFLGVTTTSPQDSDNLDDEVNNMNDDVIPNNTEPIIEIASIDINAVDTLGRTCIHYLVQPFSYLNNIELLELLYKLGSSLTVKDNNGLSPLDYSLMNGCQHLYDKLINEEQIDLTKSIIKRFIVNDPHKELVGLSDYYSDAQRYIDKHISDNSLENLETIYEVDPVSNMSQTGEILIDTDKNEPYDVRLTITDVDYGLIGLYNFYRMQIIKHKTKSNLYLLLTRWGRIGEGDGQHQLTPFSTFDECRQEFCKIFRDKTGNSWENTNQFETKPKKYTLIQLNKRQMEKYLDVPIDFDLLQDDKQHPSSQLQSSSYKNLFKTFLNSESIRSYLEKTQLDIQWMPVSQLKPESLQRARDILTQLKQIIEDKEKLKLIIQQSAFNNTETQQTIDPIQKDQFKYLLDSICNLTNEYYSLIPLQGYGYGKLPIIDNQQTIESQQKKLHDLFELELSYKIILAAQANLNKMSPLDYLYKSINCQFEALNKNDLDSQFILRYIWTSAPNIQVEQIFKMDRPNDDERLFQRNLDNHYLLWHGTDICNLISILSRGLLVGPLYATHTGSSFGKGIYTADVFAKSLHYCSAVRQDGVRRCFMLLCQVALGNSQEVSGHNNYLNEPLDLKQYQSRIGCGSDIPDPQYTITRDYGVRMPLGQLIQCTDPKHNYHRCQYNEYIVFDESQIALRYLVQFRT